MNVIADHYIDAFVAAARKAGKHQLTLCSSGNMSWRVDDEKIMISRTHSWLPELERDQVCVCRLEDGASLNGLKPSMERGFHFGILRARKDVNVVLHFQSPNATTIACTPHEPLNYNIVAEVPCYIGPVAEIPYIRPGSEELAAAVIEAMKTHNLCQLNGHGQVVVGVDFKEAFERAKFFDFACGIMLRSGFAAKGLNAEQIEDLKKYVS